MRRSEKWKAKLQELMRLPPGWYGPKSIPVDKEVAAAALLIAERLVSHPGDPEPHFVPGEDGSIQIEWHVSGLDVDIDVSKSDAAKHS